jgi:hypothetical protein
MEASAGRRCNGGDCARRATKRDGNSGDPPWPGGAQGENSGSGDDENIFATGAYGPVATGLAVSTPWFLNKIYGLRSTGRKFAALFLCIWLNFDLLDILFTILPYARAPGIVNNNCADRYRR